MALTMMSRNLSWPTFGAMLEPRYSSSGSTTASRLLEATTSNHHRHVHDHLDTAVDLSRKASITSVDVPSSAEAMEADESEDDAPLDLKVRPDSSSKSRMPAYPTLAMPGPQQRAELLRIAELYTSGSTAMTGVPPSSRESSQERDTDLCQFCGSDTTSPDFDSADHKEGVCNRGSIACPLCAKTFTLYSQYEAHKKTHQKMKQRQYPCQTCGKIFTSASNRNMHQRIHKGVRPFQCTPCGVFFRQKAHLQKHQKTQGHIQATDIYEKKKRDGLITEIPTYQDDDSSHQTQLSKRELDEEDDAEESIQSEDNEPMADSTQSVTPPAADSSHEEKNFNSSAASTTSSVSSFNGANHSRAKASPKRKQSRPQYLQTKAEEVEESAQEPEATSLEEDKIGSFIDYNDITHGYDCRQCMFSSHELSVLKDHVKEEHLNQESQAFQCNECCITFNREFNLRIHTRQHDSGNDLLPCDHCNEVWRSPNKLLKHMELSHLICARCGSQYDERSQLEQHLEEEHEDAIKKGFHNNLAQFSQLNHLATVSLKSPPIPTNVVASAENRAAKMRKVDSLADSIRQKQLLQTLHATSSLNGNDVYKSPASPHHPSPNLMLTSPGSRRRKNDMQTVRALLAKNPEPLYYGSLNQNDRNDNNPFHPHHHAKSMVQDLLRKSENNNILSSKSFSKLPPSIQLPTQPVSGLTPPSSPPLPPPPPPPLAVLPPHSSADHNRPEAHPHLNRRHTSLHHRLHPAPPAPAPAPHHHHHIHHHEALHHPQPHHIRGEVSVTIVPPLGVASDDSDPEENGLDLSIGNRERRHKADSISVDVEEEDDDEDDEDENQVSTTARDEADFRGRLPLAPAFPPGMPFPFFGGLLPPVPPGTDPALAEHLMKLSGLPRPSVLSGPAPNDLVKPPPSSLSHHYSVLSAMLGQPGPPPSAYQSVFPGMTPSIFPGQNGPISSSTPTSSKHEPKDLGPNLDSKPFHCNFCRKEFSHLSSLESHIEHMHHGESKHICNTCGKNFSSKSNLTAHKKIHSGERPFECGICHKRFRQKAHLQKHETTHSSATPYKCTVCDKAFGHISNLNTHLATHSNIRPHQCGECGKSYKDSASYKRHMLSHHGLGDSAETSHSERTDHDQDHDFAEDDDDDEDDEGNETSTSVDTSGCHDSSALTHHSSGLGGGEASSSAYSSFESQEAQEAQEAHLDQSSEIEVGSEALEKKMDEEHRRSPPPMMHPKKKGLKRSIS
ncbi:uncharacterized protein LOC131888450 isoform X1 [Tigriopus californicus]|uniref:uncharacterized protein LOC131888450 isoform X1 n=1 Tax=Tigriopus californicus TaxID=6832 RepID=UPI0027DA492A|nr:uncharacterized protein LOC131888450 isoform X1 [Tigriopus californicus]